MPRALIVDDDEIFCTQLCLYIQRIGPACDIAGTLRQGLAMAQEQQYDIVFLDVVLPDSNGIDGIAAFKQGLSQPEVIIITGRGNPDGAEMAIRNGAWYYLEKPPAFHTINLLINRALEYRERKLQSRERKILQRDFIIGNNAKLIECLDLVAQATESESNVLITGETGTGKELFARAVHLNSSRAKHQFVTVDCTNIPVTLAESILFGHTRGAFTGATQDREGLVVQADRGTLHLDEVGDLPLGVQKSLLRVLQDKKFRPLGAKREVACNFRVVATTNKDLKQMIEEEKFRKDLYFRLVAFHIHLPPLRERHDDIKLLTNHYVHQICSESARHTKGFSNDFLEALIGYDWPGNVRELVNVLNTTIANALSEPILYPHHLPEDVRIHFFKKRACQTQQKDAAGAPLCFGLEKAMHFTKFPTIKEFREASVALLEGKYLDELARQSGSRLSEAIRLSGLARAQLYRLLKKHAKSLRE